MISLFGTSIAATSPWLLVGIPCALTLLVYIFRVRGTAHQAVVSSLLFLQHLPKRPVGRKVFVPPLQFWLELAIFTLLILATSGLFLSHSGTHVAVVIDSSMSMGALYGSGGTRLDQAKNSASIDMQRAPSSTTYSVFSATTTLSPLTQPRDSASHAATVIQSVSQSYRRDSLAEYLPRLLSDPSYDAVWLYTDKEIAPGNTSPRLVVTSIPFDPTLQTNAWIQSVQTIGDSLAVQVSYVGAMAREVLVGGECFSADSPSSRKLTPTTLRLAPQTSSRAELSLASNSWEYCRIFARLQDAALFDSLPLDNEAWITRSDAPPPITLHSSLSPAQLGLSKLSQFSFRPSGSITDDNAEIHPAIFHRTAPSKTPAGAALLVLPPVGPLPWGGSVTPRALKLGEITRWNESHPLLTYVRPSLVALPEAHPLECPSSSVPVLFSSAGPVACAGEDQGSRYLIIGFELFPFEGGKNPTLSILTLNAFKWLFQSSTASTQESLPSSLSVTEMVKAAAYIQPNEQKVTIQSGTILPTGPGVLRLTMNDDSRRLIALNSFEDSESDLFLRTPLSVQQTDTIASSAGASSATQPLLPWLASIALVVIAIDILRRLIRRSRWSDA